MRPQQTLEKKYGLDACLTTVSTARKPLPSRAARVQPAKKLAANNPLGFFPPQQARFSCEMFETCVKGLLREAGRAKRMLTSIEQVWLKDYLSYKTLLTSSQSVA